MSSQVFHVPPSCSGDASIGTEDQHRFIVPERSPAPHDSLTLRPRQYIQSKEVIKIPTFLLRVPGHGPFGYTWLGHDNLQFTRYRLPKSSGAPPLWSTGVKRRPANDHGTPRAPYNNLHRQKYLATPLTIYAVLEDT